MERMDAYGRSGYALFVRVEARGMWAVRARGGLTRRREATVRGAREE